MTISGTVSYQAKPGGSYFPAADEPFQVYVNSNAVTIRHHQRQRRLHFKRRPAGHASTTWTVGAGNGAGIDLFGPAEVTAGLPIRADTRPCHELPS